VRIIIDAITERCKGEGGAEHNDIISKARDQGVAGSDIQPIIARLLKDGRIYEEKYGVYKVT
jgi:DNA replicative helicase MCM subunit Mcm2 (Cdc46/Mcm family)